MTALNFILQEEIVLISMDTLSIRNTGQNHKFVTKIFPLPHINCVMCGTGNLKAILDWFLFIQEHIIANGIYQLNMQTSNTITDFMKTHNGENSCTIYQFGLHEIDNKFHGYAYRSSNGFLSEELDYNIYIKPSEAIVSQDGKVDFNMPAEMNVDDVFRTFASIMKKQKEYDDLSSERIGIGGYIQILVMNNNGYTLTNYERFDDYESTHESILENIKE